MLEFNSIQGRVPIPVQTSLKKTAKREYCLCSAIDLQLGSTYFYFVWKAKEWFSYQVTGDQALIVDGAVQILRQHFGRYIGMLQICKAKLHALYTEG